MRRVVITGLGAISPLGVGVRRTWSRLLQGHSGISSLDQHPDYAEAFANLPSRVAGLVPRGLKRNGAWDPTEWLSATEIRQMAPFTHFAVAAAEEALHDAGCIPTTDEQREAFGVSVGSGIGAFSDIYNTSLAFAAGGHRKVSPLFVPRLLINLAAGHIAMRYDLRGPNLSPTTACTTGAHALLHAYHTLAIPTSTTNVMLAGAAEAAIHPLAVSGFARARSLATAFNHTPSTASRPFDAARDGFVIAEGSAALVLESFDHAVARGAHIYAELVGHGESCDAAHITAPLPDGRGAVQAMRAALRSAELSPRQVDYVNAHATSTRLGDAAENRAIQTVLLSADGWNRPDQVCVSSTKGATGHLLGAAGALESLFAVLAISEGVVPPTINLNNIGDDDENDQSAWRCNYVPNEAQQRDVKVALTNSFGFGGTNACLAFRRFEK